MELSLHDIPGCIYVRYSFMYTTSVRIHDNESYKHWQDQIRVKGITARIMEFNKHHVRVFLVLPWPPNGSFWGCLSLWWHVLPLAQLLRAVCDQIHTVDQPASTRSDIRIHWRV